MLALRVQESKTCNACCLRCRSWRGLRGQFTGLAMAPRTEPLARLSPPIQCSPEVEVLYAGLAPGFYSLYQVDVRILAPYAGRAALDINCAGTWTKVAVEP